jgi:hypothetical protein
LHKELSAPVEHEHLVQLFDDLSSLSDGVARFLHDGFAKGNALLVVATAEHWEAIAARLGARGCTVAEWVHQDRLVVLDARETLASFMKAGRPDAILFDETVGALVRTLSARGRPLRIYGEMVDVLATEAMYAAARQLEALWNRLAERESFVLFCGYDSSNFGNPLTGDALRSICQLHSRVQCGSSDVLGSFLLHTHVGGAIHAPRT